ncbi:MAG TPA: glycosyltransferase family 2 protein [Jatrophihabitantaceae bacterium]|jgi:hyaluronan synthase
MSSRGRHAAHASAVVPSSRQGRSRRPRGLALAVCALALAGFAGYVLHSQLSWSGPQTLFLSVFYGALAALVVYFVVAGTRWRSFSHLPVAPGRVIAIVPAYNEEPDLLRNTVLALAAQTHPPDAIYVMDDGSKVPVEPFDCPGVHWLVQPNQGKRHAQANVLKLFDPDEWDYIFTVDSDSVVDADALEHMLRAMSDPEVQACTGMLLVRNWRDNLLTRLVDINVVTSCLLARMARSSVGAVCPTSGALALYRADVVYDNMDDYCNSGTVGDDRRLSLYALLRGRVVAVNEAVVETALPTTWRGTFKQRLRWSQSAWLATPFVITNLRLVPMAFYLYPLCFAVMWPFVIAALVFVTAESGSWVLLYGVAFWIVVALTETAVYAAYRPNLTMRDRTRMWLTSLLLPVLGLVVLRPAMYWALTKLTRKRSKAWGTRESPVPRYDPSEV